MGRIAIFCLALMPALAQEVTWLGEHASHVTRDAQGNWFAVEPAEQNAGNRDLRVRKLSPDLAVTLWTRLIGGTGSEELRALLADSGGALLVLGDTTSKDFPVTPGVVAATPPSGPASAFLVKLDLAGDLAFSTYLHDGTATRAENLLHYRGDEIVLALTGRLWRIDPDATRLKAEIASPWIGGPMQLDDLGKLWVAGATQADDLPVSVNTFQTARQSGICSSFVGPINCATGFIMRLSASTGLVEAATYLGGTAPAAITSIRVDRNGSPIVTGNVRGGSLGGHFPTTPGSFQPIVRTRGSSPWFVSRENFQSTPFVARLTPDLDELVYGTYVAGTRAERVTWLSVDQHGRAVIAGDTVSHDFPATGAFATPCGPDPGPNAPSSSFVARLSSDGTSLDASAILFNSSIGVPFDNGAGSIAIPGTRGLAQVSLQSPDRPVVACTVNGADFRAESFVAPGQLVTLIGAGIPSSARLLFDCVPAELLYLAPDQINAVVPADVRGRESTQMALEVDGEYSNLRVFAVRQANPTVKVFVRPDGTLENRGSPLADVRLESGARNNTENPARRGEMVDIYATGLDLLSPVDVFLADSRVSGVEVIYVDGTARGVQKVRVRIPDTANGGVVTIAIQNGGQRSVDNAGFLWVR